MKRETMTGEELRTAIKALGLTYREAAGHLGLTLDGLNKQMRGDRPVSRQTELLLGYVEEAVERASAAAAASAPRSGTASATGTAAPLRSRQMPAPWHYPIPAYLVREGVIPGAPGSDVDSGHATGRNGDPLRRHGARKRPRG
jgi:hypothetical protein